MRPKITFKIEDIREHKSGKQMVFYALIIHRGAGSSELRGKALIGEPIVISEDEVAGN